MEIKLKELDKALTDLDQQSRIIDNYAENYYYRAMIYIAKNDFQQAKLDLEKAKRLFNGEGYHFSDPYVEMTDEVHLEDIETALKQLSDHEMLKSQ